MKLGFVSAILDSWTYEEMMDFASEHGFECVEAAQTICLSWTTRKAKAGTMEESSLTVR